MRRRELAGLSHAGAVREDGLGRAEFAFRLRLRLERVGPPADNAMRDLFLGRASLQHCGHRHSKLVVLHFAHGAEPEVHRCVEVAAHALSVAFKEEPRAVIFEAAPWRLQLLTTAEATVACVLGGEGHKE